MTQEQGRNGLTASLFAMTGSMDVVTPTAESHGAALGQVKQACETLRSLLQSLHEEKARGRSSSSSSSHGRSQSQLKEQRWQVLMLLRALKAGLRDTFLASDAWKTRVQEKKDVIEAHQLQLQNLLYEKDHLLREIRRCRGFSTKEMDQIEFEDGSVPISADADAHRAQLARLTKELETRKRMKVQLKQLKAEIKDMDAATQTKQAFLDGLRQQVTSIEEATVGLQSYMGSNVTAQLTRQHEATTQLAAPLYALYCELDAYRQASGTPDQIKLAIVDAKSLQSQAVTSHFKRRFPAAFQIDTDRVASAAVEKSNGAKRVKGTISRSPSVAATEKPLASPSADSVIPSRSPSIGRTKSGDAATPVATTTVAVSAEKLLALRPYESTPQAEDLDANGSKHDDDQQEDQDARPVDIWQPHNKALQVELTLSVDADRATSFTLVFQYLPRTKIVTVEMVSANGKKPMKHLLTNLFPGDDGSEIPQLACNYEFLQINGELQFPLDASAARPFYWVQWICGLHPMKRIQSAQEAPRRPEPSVRNVMTQLTKRLVASEHLAAHLSLLRRGSSAVLPVHEDAKVLFPNEIKTRVIRCQEQRQPPTHDIFQLFKDQAQRSSSFHLTTTGCRYFDVEFQFEQKPAISAIIEISPEYPVRAPRFLFQAKTTTSTSENVAYENQLKEIEIEVNAHYDELVTKSTESFLLLHQLRRVQFCLDVVHRGSGDGFGRVRRGKDRRHAMVMDTASKDVRHR